MGKSNKSTCMSHSFDEKLNSTTQTSEMDLCVQFWDSDKMNVDVRFLGSSFVGHAKHDDLQLHYNNITKDLDPNHYINFPWMVPVSIKVSLKQL